MIPVLATFIATAIVAGWFIDQQARRARTAEQSLAEWIASHATLEATAANRQRTIAAQADHIATLQQRHRDAENARVVAEARADMFATAFRGEMTRQARAAELRPDEARGAVVTVLPVGRAK